MRSFLTPLGLTFDCGACTLPACAHMFFHLIASYSSAYQSLWRTSLVARPILFWHGHPAY